MSIRPKERTFKPYPSHFRSMVFDSLSKSEKIITPSTDFHTLLENTSNTCRLLKIPRSMMLSSWVQVPVAVWPPKFYQKWPPLVARVSAISENEKGKTMIHGGNLRSYQEKNPSWTKWLVVKTEKAANCGLFVLSNWNVCD